MGNFESNSLGNINESNVLIDNIYDNDEKIENISLLNNKQKKNKSLYSFNDIYLSYYKDNNDNKKMINIYCKLKYYPDYICIKDSYKIYYTYTYYQIKSWAYGENQFILTTVNDSVINFKYDTPSKCSQKLKKICKKIHDNDAFSKI